MTDLIESWIVRVRDMGGARTAEREAHLAGEIERVRRELAALDDPARLLADKRALETEVAKLEEENRELERDLAAATEARRGNRRAEAASTLAEVEVKLGALRESKAVAVLEAARAWLGPERDPYEITYEQLRRALSEDPRIDNLRRQIELLLAEAHAEAERERERMVKENEVQARVVDLRAAFHDLARNLQSSHGVTPAVTEAIELLTAQQAERLRVEMLEPRMSDARAERSWRLPRRVLAQAGTGGEGR